MKTTMIEAAHREQDLEEYGQVEVAILALNHAVDALHANTISPTVRKRMIDERDRLHEIRASLWIKLLKGERP